MSSARIRALALAGVTCAWCIGLAARPPLAAPIQVSSLTRDGLPDSLLVDPQLRPIVVDMWRRAPTFRRQVARMASEDALTVRVEVWVTQGTADIGARTSMSRKQGRLRANVRIRFGATARLVELIAHEFEHIVEQLDGIDLGQWIGRGGVYRVGGGDKSAPIETLRARRVGEVVAAEYAAGGATPVGAAQP